MNEHATWFDLLPGTHALTLLLRGYLSREHGYPGHWKALMFQESHFTLSHVFAVLLLMAFAVVGAIAFRNRVASPKENAIVPPAKLSLSYFFELFAGAVLGLMEGVMGRDNARRFFPLIGTLAVFIFFSNVLSLIPGFVPPTDTLKTNVALAAVVFVMTHVYGVRANGLAYFKHFLGPIVRWYALPLMLVMLIIELISHVARPVSLSLRLLGNIAADHKVVSIMFALVPLLVPVPFLVLGILVSVVQTLVFCLLSMVYISMAIAHDDHGEHEATHAH